MNRLLRRLAVGTAIAGAAILALGALAYASGARINSTKSIPVGLYWLSSEPVEKGAYVMFCPPPIGVFEDAKARGYLGAGFCPGGYGYLMKRVLAAKGDAVTITDEGVHVNGELLPHSAPIRVDRNGRPLPRFPAERFTLGGSELLLMSDVSGTSFDGRYFGPIHRSQIKGVIRAVFTW
jgi:conjugative transfer signal peptidase TraF